MVYIQLATPIRDFDKVRIKEVSFFDTNGETNIEKALSFKYQVFKKNGGEYISFYEKHLSITDQNFIDGAMTAIPTNGLGAYEFICKQLLKYLVDGSIEIGTIEIG